MSEIGFHVNIVNLQKVTANYTYGAVNFYLVLEYCENGSLERYLVRNQSKKFYKT